MDRAPRHSAMVDFHQHCERRWVVLEEDHEKALAQVRAEVEALRMDAGRYRALREMNWCHGPLAVVADPYSRIKLGSDCPSRDRLDDAIDDAMAAGEVKS